MMSRALVIPVGRSRASLLQSNRRLNESSLFPPSHQSFHHGRSASLHHQRASLSLLASSSRDDNENTRQYQFTQVRWKRRGGASAFTKPRPVPRKKLKQYNRRKKAQYEHKYGRHSKPGSKAAIRREFAHERWTDLLQHDGTETGIASEDYDVADALVDDLMGNTAELTSAATPEPTYLGHLHKQYYNRVFEQVENYKLQLKASNENETAISTRFELPSDKDISLVLRAYRDRHGTKSRPIGIAKALQHVLVDLGLNTSMFDEYTYTTLLTCCRTPREARRVFKLQRDHQHDISHYSWAILVDIHAKLGDYEGCQSIMEEMVKDGGLDQPPMAAYTSLLAACYKVCNAGGRASHEERAKAGRLAWSKWKELRILGNEEPDVMAYGAILRLCAARGQPERAVGLLEEMQSMNVKPTTLCFTSALRAVARSHETAVRYERSFSKKNRRREHVTAHHGKLARTIVIMAENAHVKQDDGFVAALMLCAAAAGDSATAKAVLLASEVRRMDHLRMIGSDKHLKQLRGEGADDELQLLASNSDKLGESSNQVTTVNPTLSIQKHSFPSFADREYGGKDTRALSALLLACSNAAQNRGLGDIWAGRENKGYLCENSLRLITMRREPKYVEERIPGMTYQEVARSAMVWDEEEPEAMGKRLRRKKFQGVDFDQDAGFTLDEMDDEIYNMFTNDPSEEESSELQDKVVDAQQVIFGDEGTVTQEHLSMIEGSGTAYFDAESGTYHTGITDEETKTDTITQESTDEPEEEWYFDADARKWKTRRKTTKVTPTVVEDPPTSSHQVADDSESDQEEEYFFDYDIMKWKTRPKAVAATSDSSDSIVPKENQVKEPEAVTGHSDVDYQFDLFFEGLKEEMKASGEDIEVTEAEAREFFEQARQDESISDPGLESPDASSGVTGAVREIDEDDFFMFFEGLKEQVRMSGENMVVSEAEARELFLEMKKEFSSENTEGLPSNESIVTGKPATPTSSTQESTESEFHTFLEDIKEQARDAGADINIDEKHARELFQMQKTMSSGEGEGEGEQPPDALSMGHRTKSAGQFGDRSSSDFEDIFGEIKDEWREEGFDMDDVPDFIEMETSDQEKPLEPTLQKLPAEETLNGPTGVTTVEFDDHLGSQARSVQENFDADASLTVVGNDNVDTSVASQDMADAEISPFADIDNELAEVLPGLPESRIKKIRNIFVKSLGDPSMLRLVPVLRENNPDYITPGWLKQKNLQNAIFCMRKAKQDGLIDVHMLNGMLQVETNCGGLDRALAFHEEQYKKCKVKPTPYSDRLVLQMLVKNNRLPRALAFKQKVEEAGRLLDIQSYGSIMEHYGKRGQLGSALLMLKECIAVHGAPPGEKSLTKIRLLCRQQDVEEEVGIEDLIGKDPVEWIRHGEKHLKREMSYRGRRNVLLPRNRTVQL